VQRPYAPRPQRWTRRCTARNTAAKQRTEAPRRLTSPVGRDNAQGKASLQQADGYGRMNRATHPVNPESAPTLTCTHPHTRTDTHPLTERKQIPSNIQGKARHGNPIPPCDDSAPQSNRPHTRNAARTHPPGKWCRLTAPSRQAKGCPLVAGLAGAAAPQACMAPACMHASQRVAPSTWLSAYLYLRTYLRLWPGRAARDIEGGQVGGDRGGR
jgi:hypothetical protein